MSINTLQNPPSNPTYYKRALPSTCIAFNSNKGKELFRTALEEGYLESFFSLSQQFLTQSEPAYCGISSLCMILNAFEIDPLRPWKGVWRWYDESLLDCCRPLSQIQQQGITLPEFACLAKCNGLDAFMKRADQVTKGEFLNDIKRTSKFDSEYLVVAFSRQTLQQTGEGHFSPIGGYNEKENQVLIMDVARFKYSSYWVSFDLLWDSLQPIDKATHKPRGYTILSTGKRHHYMKSAFMSLSLNYASWSRLSTILFQEIPLQCSLLPSNTSMSDFLSLVISSIPDDYSFIVEDRLSLFLPPYLSSSADRDLESESLKMYLQGLDQLLLLTSSTKLYHLVSNSMGMQNKLQRIGSATSSVIPSPIDSPFMDSSMGRSDSDSNLLKLAVKTLSRRESYASIVPPPSDVTDFVAFITLFLFALFSILPIDKSVPDLQDMTRKELKMMIDISHLPKEVRIEVELLRDQIMALVEVEKNKCL